MGLFGKDKKKVPEGLALPGLNLSSSDSPSSNPAPNNTDESTDGFPKPKSKASFYLAAKKKKNEIEDKALAANQAFFGGDSGTGGHIKGTKRKIGLKIAITLATLPIKATVKCVDFSLRAVGLRRRIRPKLKEVIVRNSDKDGERLHLNCIWPCETLILKKKLQAFVGVRSDNQRLVYCGKILKDDEIIPEDCFKADPKDGSDMVFHIWMINVGFSMDKYTAMKGKESRLGATGAKIVPDDTLEMEDETEEERLAREEEERVRKSAVLLPVPTLNTLSLALVISNTSLLRSSVVTQP